MPVIFAQKKGPCSACGGLIRKGEEIHFERALGARHVECASAPASARVNTHRAVCARCGTMVEAGEGRLELVREALRADSSWVRTWEVTCWGCSRP